MSTEQWGEVCLDVLYQEDIATAKDGEVLVVGFFCSGLVEDLKDYIVCGCEYAYP